MGKFKDFMAKAYNKSKDAVKEELAQRRKIRLEIQEMSDKKLKEMAISKGQPYEDAWVQRKKNKKRLNERVKNV